MSDEKDPKKPTDGQEVEGGCDCSCCPGCGEPEDGTEEK